MEAQRESFIFHMEYIEGVPEELEAQYAMYAINYARYGKEPELTDWRDVRMWNKTKQRIDEEAEKYEKRCSNLKHHKTPKAEERTDDESTTNRERIDYETAGEYEFEYESEFENETETESADLPEEPLRESPPLQTYAKKIFDIFQAAGLPCARGNFISFLQRDFKNALGYIHKHYGPIHSDEVIGAAENYARTVNDPASFITGKYSFDRFVTFKNFVDFLPANYNADNFKDRKAEATQQPAKREWKDTCPACGTKMLAWNNQDQKYVCGNCGRKFDYEEVNQ